MANRHKAQAFKRGGKPALAYGNKDVAREGFSTKSAPGKKDGGKADKKAKGGEVETKATGGAAKPRLDKRARGGGSPFSAAHVKTSGDA